MKGRLNEFDWLRVIATFAVIGIHITSQYVAVNERAFVLNQAVRFAVPLFIILSGFLLQYNSMNNGKVEYSAFIAKRLNKIFIPYVVWTLIYMLYSNRHHVDNVFTYSFSLSYFKNIILGTASVHLYFIVIILQLYIIYNFMEWLLSTFNNKLILLITFVITFYVQSGLYLHNYNIHIIPRIGIGYHILFPTWIFYFVFGMYFARNEQKYREKLLSSNIILGVIWIVSYLMLLVDGKISKTYGSSMKPGVMIYCMASFMFFYAILSRKAVKDNAFISWISQQSFFIFFSHVMLIDIIKSFISHTGLTVSWGSSAGILLMLILDTGTALAMAYLVSYLPFSNVLGCVAKRRHTNAKSFIKYFVDMLFKL